MQPGRSTRNADDSDSPLAPSRRPSHNCNTGLPPLPHHRPEGGRAQAQLNRCLAGCYLVFQPRLQYSAAAWMLSGGMDSRSRGANLRLASAHGPVPQAVLGQALTGVAPSVDLLYRAQSTLGRPTSGCHGGGRPPRAFSHLRPCCAGFAIPGVGTRAKMGTSDLNIDTTGRPGS